jgi:hypothetical protein
VLWLWEGKSGGKCNRPGSYTSIPKTSLDTLYADCAVEFLWPKSASERFTRKAATRIGSAARRVELSTKAIILPNIACEASFRYYILSVTLALT